MSDDLISLRMLIVSGPDAGRDLLRRGAAHASVPVEVIEADGAADACTHLQRDGIDLAMLDATLPDGERAAIAKIARALGRPPFVTPVAPAHVTELSFDTDGLVMMPGSHDEAERLFNRLVRVCLPTRVLVVDDSSTMRSIVRKILAASRFPFDIAEAEEGGAALELVHRGGFDIIFLDCHMPGFDGFQTLAEIRRAKSDVQVVMITSTNNEALAARASADGAAFLKKPFYPADIDAMLCSFYGLRAIRSGRT